MKKDKIKNLHIAPATYEYGKNYSDSEGPQIYQDFSESVTITDDEAAADVKAISRPHRNVDEDVHARVTQALIEHVEIDQASIHVRVKENVVFLTGTIESRHAKLVVEQVVESLSGVFAVQNELRIDTTTASKNTTHEAVKS